jgi:hypothetical protein
MLQNTLIRVNEHNCLEHLVGVDLHAVAIQNVREGDKQPEAAREHQ